MQSISLPVGPTAPLGFYFSVGITVPAASFAPFGCCDVYLGAVAGR